MRIYLISWVYYGKTEQIAQEGGNIVQIQDTWQEQTGKIDAQIVQLQQKVRDAERSAISPQPLIQEMYELLGKKQAYEDALQELGKFKEGLNPEDAPTLIKHLVRRIAESKALEPHYKEPRHVYSATGQQQAYAQLAQELRQHFSLVQ